ncbi:MAG: TRAP transporter small permease [Spirochaetales bacterium]|nr:TRAP transporter small permease [Spirochaetales bacterium]
MTATMLTSLLKKVVYILAAIAGCGIAAMIGITCCDVILRIFGSGLIGAFDLVRITFVVTIACGLPYVTSVKGHVAIEFFFHKLPEKGRVIVDTGIRILSVLLFGLLAWQSVQYGLSLFRSGEVTPTLQVPIFWLGFLICLDCVVVMFVILYHLFHPGKVLIEP